VDHDQPRARHVLEPHRGGDPHPVGGIDGQLVELARIGIAVVGGVMVLLLWFWVSSVVLLTSGQMNKVIEDASPLGKSTGQKEDKTETPDFSKIAPEPLHGSK